MVMGTLLPHPSGRDAAIVVHRATSALVTVASAPVRALASISRSPGLNASRVIGSVVVSDMACSFQRGCAALPDEGLLPLLRPRWHGRFCQGPGCEALAEGNPKGRGLDGFCRAIGQSAAGEEDRPQPRALFAGHSCGEANSGGFPDAVGSLKAT